VRKSEINYKRTFVDKLVIKTYEAISSNDITLAIKLIKNINIQIARIILISENIIPKSRPELISQLSEINSPFTSIILTESKLINMNSSELVNYVDKIYKRLEKFLNNLFNSE